MYTMNALWRYHVAKVVIIFEKETGELIILLHILRQRAISGGFRTR